MPRSRSRSRSQRRSDGDRKDEKKEDPPRKEGVAEAAKSGSSEQEIVSVAIRQLPGDIRERLEKLFEEGLLKEGDLDLRSITVFASLNEGLQARVMNHMENERIYVANARSKSGFLIATCDKAKTGCLDARGLGAIDPWRTALVAMATPKQRMIDLKPERDWLDKHEEGAVIKINVSVACVEKELGVPSVTVELPLTETSAAVKAKLVAMGVKSLPANKMKLHTEPVGFLKESHTFAFYNLDDGVTLTLSERKRGGVRFRADHTAMPKRPRTQPQPGEAATSPVDALQKLVGAAGAKLPALPALPKLPGLAGATAPAAGGSMPAPLPGLSGSLAALAGTAPGAATGPAGSSPAIGNLLGGLRPPLGAQGLAPGAAVPGMLPGGISLPGAGTQPGLGMPGMGMPKAGDDMAKAKAPLLPDGKAPGGLLPPPSLNLVPAPGMSGPGGLMPPGGSQPGMMAKMGSMPPGMPMGGGMSKAGGGMPGMPGMDLLPKAQSKSQMPMAPMGGGMVMPKMMGMSPTS